jgi:hypothetical protein
MFRLRLQKLIARPYYQKIRIQNAAVMFCFMIIITSVLASCGSAAVGQAPTPVPTQVASPTPIPTLAPTPTATPPPTPTPKPKPTTPPAQPTQPPVTAAQPILDLRPSSMSIVGHLDCNKGQTYICFARVLSRPDAQRPLNWFAFTNVPGHIGFSPSGGSLGPGQSVLVTITVPFNDCTPGLFFFRGPINTHTITWAC